MRSQYQQHHGGATLSNTLRGDSVAETFGNIVSAGQQPDVHQVTYSSQTVDQTRNFHPIPLLQTTGMFHTAETTQILMRTGRTSQTLNSYHRNLLPVTQRKLIQNIQETRIYWSQW